MVTFRCHALFLVQTSLDNPASYRKPVIYSAERRRAFPRNGLQTKRGLSRFLVID